MPQLTLYAPAIHCDHCIATIRRTVDAQPGARFLDGNWETRSFDIEIDSGAVLDAVAAALSAEEYPLGDAESAAAAIAATGGGAVAEGPTHPSYRVTRTEAGADLNYECPCGCTAGFAFDRSQAEQAPESCCCGRMMLVGARAAERLRGALDESAHYPVDVQTVTMPWGQPMEAALATPHEAEHGQAPGGPVTIAFQPADIGHAAPRASADHGQHSEHH
jgi:copper chaperone CopZ